MLDFGNLGLTWHFGTPVYISNVRQENLNAVQTEFGQVFDKLVEDGTFKHHPTSHSHYLSDPTFSENLFEKYGTENFVRELEFHLRNYMEMAENGIGTSKPFEYKIRGAWMTLNPKGSYAVIHDHGESDISGVYYFNTNGEDGDFFFETPNKLLRTSYCFKHFGRSWAHKPEVGKLILFPGWLEHGVCTNHTDNNRVSISFNISFVKD